nr:MAG TPA: hypothetical protein [Caudoviricetes sp.]
MSHLEVLESILDIVTLLSFYYSPLFTLVYLSSQGE